MVMQAFVLPAHPKSSMKQVMALCGIGATVNSYYVYIALINCTIWKRKTETIKKHRT